MKIRLKTLQECILMGRVEASCLKIDNVSFSLNSPNLIKAFGTEIEAKIDEYVYYKSWTLPKSIIDEVIIDTPKDWENTDDFVLLDRGVTFVSVGFNTTGTNTLDSLIIALQEHANYHRQKELMK